MTDVHYFLIFLVVLIAAIRVLGHAFPEPTDFYSPNARRVRRVRRALHKPKRFGWVL